MSIILVRKNLQNLEWHAAEMRQCCFILWMSGKMPYGSDRWKRQKKREAFWILMPLEEGKIKILPEFQTFAHQSVTEIDGARFYAEQFSYDGKVYIFGGGHLAQELVPVLSHLGFRCIVSDDREEFTKPELFPERKRYG